MPSAKKKFFEIEQISLDLGKIEAKFGQKWSDFGKFD